MSFLEIFKEQNGDWSSMRIMCVLGVAAIIGTWSYLSIKNNALQPVSAEDVALVGVLVTGKVLQKKIEGKKNEPPSKPTTVESPEGDGNMQPAV